MPERHVAKRICLCRSYPGCKGTPDEGAKLCAVCIASRHRAYTDRQLASYKR